MKSTNPAMIEIKEDADKWKRLVSEKTRETKDNAYPIITEAEDRKLQSRVNKAVREYAELFLD